MNNDNMNNQGMSQNNMMNQYNNQGMPQNNMMNQYNNQGMPQNNMMNQYNNQGMPQNNGNNNLKDNKKVIYIIIGVVALVAVLIILYFTVFKKDRGYEDYLKQEEQIKEKINKNFTFKDYKTQDGILIELKNNNDVIVHSDIKVEFYDENGNLVNVEEDYIIDTPAKGIAYTEVYVDEATNYSSYKTIIKLEKSNRKTYNDKIEIVSNNVRDGEIIIQAKNNSNVNLENVELGIIYVGPNNTIMDYDVIYIDDIGAGEIASEKSYIPYDNDTYENIKYEKLDIIVVSAAK